MNHSPSVQIKPFTVRPQTAAALFDAPHLFQQMVKAGWVKPCYKSNRCTLYLVTDLEKCAERLAKGERPDHLMPVSSPTRVSEGNPKTLIHRS